MPISSITIENFKGINEPVRVDFKPITLLRWLIRLVTPPGGIVLDPFVGSGSTLCAAACEHVEVIGCDLDPCYVKIAQARERWWARYGTAAGVEAKADAVDRESGQLGLF